MKFFVQRNRENEPRIGKLEHNGKNDIGSSNTCFYFFLVKKNDKFTKVSKFAEIRKPSEPILVRFVDRCLFFSKDFLEEFRNKMAATGKGKRVSLDGTNFMRQFRDEESR